MIRFHHIIETTWWFKRTSDLFFFFLFDQIIQAASAACGDSCCLIVCVMRVVQQCRAVQAEPRSVPCSADCCPHLAHWENYQEMQICCFYFEVKALQNGSRRFQKRLEWDSGLLIHMRAWIRFSALKSKRDVFSCCWFTKLWHGRLTSHWLLIEEVVVTLVWNHILHTKMRDYTEQVLLLETSTFTSELRNNGV